MRSDEPTRSAKDFNWVEAEGTPPQRLTRNAKTGNILSPLKTTLLLIALMFSSPAIARIGETPEQLNKRYGKPLETIRENLETRRYLFRGFIILVGLEKGISQCEVYRKEDNSRMTESDIYGLLEANTGSSEWVHEPKENFENYVYWSKDKKTRVGIYNLATHRLMITSKECLPRCAQLVNSSNRKAMEGF